MKASIVSELLVTDNCYGCSIEGNRRVQWIDFMKGH